jgi:ABC-type arginine transport system permease subunit
MLSTTSDQALLDSVTTAATDLQGVVAGVANVSVADGANAAATPQTVFDAITTGLDSANTALAGAQA